MAENSDATNEVAAKLGYSPRFNPDDPHGGASGVLGGISPFGTEKPRQPYVYHVPEIALAVNVALVTERPLLLSGRPGSGKSTLARHVAWCLGWEYLEDTVTSRTLASDLQWRFDALQRLIDASTPDVTVGDEAEYVEPGILWWIFNPASAHKASRRLKKKKVPEDLKKVKGIVALLDEIDKAEPDVPNDLLVPLADRVFHPRGHGEPVQATLPFLLCLTTNGERELPQAFVRRCVTLSLTRPLEGYLREIATRHVLDLNKEDALLDDVLKAFRVLEKETLEERRRPPSTAEFLDAVKACRELDPADRGWLADFTMRKRVEIRDPENEEDEGGTG